jgi:hypothetical protein
MSDFSKIVVFTGDLNYSVRKGITQIDRAIPGLSWLVVFSSPKKTASRVLRSQWRNLQRNGWRWIFYQTLEVLPGLLVRVPAESPPSVPGGEFTTGHCALEQIFSYSKLLTFTRPTRSKRWMPSHPTWVCP